MQLDVIPLILLITLLQSLIYGLLYWLIVSTEGVYLGRQFVIWLYDLFAPHYENIKAFNVFFETFYLARPIMEVLHPNKAPLVLDVATGTGRLPRLLMRQSDFQGRVIGIDLSRKMLHIAAGRLAESLFHKRVYLMHLPAERLPFPDDTFDCVACLEALEFMSSPKKVVKELTRVTRPGGLLLLTNRRGFDAKIMPGKAWSQKKAQHIYEQEMGLQHVRFETWQDLYDCVWAIKPGDSLPTRARQLGEIWLCPKCGTIDMIDGDGEWMCGNCEHIVPEGKDGIIEAR